MRGLFLAGAAIALLFPMAGCDEGDGLPRTCRWASSSMEAPTHLQQLGCTGDFGALASNPIDSSIPGARSVKVVLDRADDSALYFQNSVRYPIHWEFARAHLSGNGRPVVGELSQFNEVEYYSPDRRFILGAVTHYEGPGVWVLELSPYDTASAEMIELIYQQVAANTFFGDALRFHPTSVALAEVAKSLPSSVKVISTDELFAGVRYQPLNLRTSVGRLRFVRSADLEDAYVHFRDIVVLDRVPNDISVVSGIITGEFQTPLSHINVLSQNRGTPNMGLRDALTDERLTGLRDKWVRLTVRAFDWQIEEVTEAEANRWWEENRPRPVGVPRLDTEYMDLTDLQGALDTEMPLREAIRAWIPRLGGKASHYAALTGVEGIPAPRAFAVPVGHYQRFLEDNGFDDDIRTMLADTARRNDPAVRDRRLRELRNRMRTAPVHEELLTAIERKWAADYEGVRLRFRSSTNAEDLEGFTGAGLYTSKSARAGDRSDLEDAIRQVWASVWRFRAFEERSYRSIDHQAVAMALLVHRSFPDEDANGVALTANPFDTSGLEPGFYVNVQFGGASVVLPGRGVTTDQFIYQYHRPGRPVIVRGRSNQLPEGREAVLTAAQIYALGQALDAIHRRFLPAYGPPRDNPTAWFAMDVEFKFDASEGGTSRLFIKQARPHPGRGGSQ